MEPWYFCPACGMKDIDEIGKAGYGRRRYACANCRAVFLANDGIGPEDYAELAEYPQGPVQMDWPSMAGHELDAVTTIAVRADPRIARYANDPAVRAWADRYWRYIEWNEHGNQLTWDELAFEGCWAEILESIVRDPAEIMGYLAPDGIEAADPQARELIAELDALRRTRRR